MLDVRWRGRLLREQVISAEYVRNNSGENILEHFAFLPDIASRAMSIRKRKSAPYHRNPSLDKYSLKYSGFLYGLGGNTRASVTEFFGRRNKIFKEAKSSGS